jgi:flagellar biosynthesis protein FlhG
MVESVSPPLLEDLAPTTRRIYAVGGGRSGVGKSVLATNLAVYLAQMGRKVALIDADPAGGNCHHCLGVDRPLHVTKPASAPATLIETSVMGLACVLSPELASDVGRMKGRDQLKYVKLIHSISDRDVVINVGAGVSNVTCELFALGEVGLLVTIPEPQAIETMYRFVRGLYSRELRVALRSEPTRLRDLERALLEFDTLAPPIEICRYLAKHDAGLGAIAASVLTRLRPRFAINQTRVKSDLELAANLTLVCERRLGVRLDFVGAIDHDDAVWLAHRQRQPLLVNNPSSKAGRGIERMARRLLASAARAPRLATDDESTPTNALHFAKLDHYERLQIPRGASEEEARRAVKRLREFFAKDSLAVQSLYSREELAREHAMITEAFDVLLDPVRRRAYDISTFPNHSSPAVSTSNSEGSATQNADMLKLAAQLAKQLGPDTEYSGELLRRIRESRAIELATVSDKTKIPQQHLQAIEDEDFEKLPAMVYVRGFLVEFAKHLRLDPSQVSKSYLRRARDILDLGPR